MSIELDHIFWMIDKRDVSRVTTRLSELGLRESYRRDHPGQGTTNICYCFDNAFLEILWLEHEEDARSPAIARTLLADRGEGKANPFGIAWRGAAGLPMWDFMPPYLPEGVAIQMATASDDPAVPLLFTFSGFKPPTELPPERHGGMQREAGFSRLDIAQVSCRKVSALQDIAGAMAPGFDVVPGDHSMTLTLTGPERAPFDLTLPF